MSTEFLEFMGTLGFTVETEVRIEKIDATVFGSTIKTYLAGPRKYVITLNSERLNGTFEGGTIEEAEAMAMYAVLA